MIAPARRRAAALAFAALACACAAQSQSADEPPAPPRAGWERTPDGLILTPASGPARKVRLAVMSDRIIRVTASATDDVNAPASLMVIAAPAGDAFDIEETREAVTLRTARVSAEVSRATGLVRFRNAAGEVVLAESRRSFALVSIAGRPYYAIRQQFNPGTDEGFYGLGQHQNGQFDYNGEDVVLAQRNMEIAIPFVVSTRNYGLLWDNNSVTHFGAPRDYQPLARSLRMTDAEGRDGGFSARYYSGADLRLSRVEADPNYQFLQERESWPAEMRGAPDQRVVYEGRITSDQAGVHRFKLYVSGYVKVFVDGEKIIDAWRQNWNPWHRNFDLTMEAGRPRAIRIEWTPQDGHFRLLHLDPAPPDERHRLSLASEVGQGADYYFISGDDMDGVIAGYRRLTGKARILPRWAYGFWQSRQRYMNQNELLDVVAEYRRRRIPLDNIVLDWFYWREDAWGSHEFDSARFPDPAGMVRQVHDQHARIMISVWPKFYPSTRNFQELDAAGLIYRRNIEVGAKDWVGPGYLSSFYDAFSPQGRAIYWRQVRERLGVLGFDAWWLDAVEPDMQSNISREEQKLRMNPTALGPGAALYNAYPLPHAEGVFAGLQAADPGRRAFILTRSGWGGIQRAGAALWSGDIAARWSDLREQISAGLNLSLSGIPNWTFDIGGFAVEQRYTSQDPAHVEEWRELNLRWHQFGAFAPLYRAHGEFPYREIYNVAPRGSAVYDALVWTDRLRYRLMPYIYTIAAETYHDDSTIMRGLVMDFPADPRVRGVGEQYMFGPAFLVSPVYEFRARTRRLYLPAGTAWYDFYSGRRLEGGQEIEAPAPLARMPLFVRAGSIVPIGPDIQYTDENLAGPITLYVYAGRDGAFSLYEDDGATYAYERGRFARIPIAYDDAAGTLTIGDRVGAYDAMPQARTFRVRWIAGPRRGLMDFDARPDASVRYAGQAVTVRLSPRPRRRRRRVAPRC